MGCFVQLETNHEHLIEMVVGAGGGPPHKLRKEAKKENDGRGGFSKLLQVRVIVRVRSLFEGYRLGARTRAYLRLLRARDVPAASAGGRLDQRRAGGA